MMKTIFNLLYLFFIFNLSFAQQVAFEKYYNFGYAEAGNCVQQTNDGGYIIAGRQGIAIGTSKILLMKTDIYGVLQWVNFIGSHESIANSVKQTFDGGYILTGQTTNANFDYYIYLVKTNAVGDTTWTKSFNYSSYGEAGESIIQTADSGYMIAAFYAKTDTTNAAFIIKTNANGDSLWSKEYYGLYQAASYSVAQTNDSGYVIVGTTHAYSSNEKGEIYLIKTDKSGDTLWTKIIGSPIVTETAYSVQQCLDKGYFLSGSLCCADTGYVSDVLLVKTDSSGEILWTKQVGGAEQEIGFHGEQTADSGFIITGFTDSFDSSEIYLIRTNSNGDTLWTKAFGDHHDDGYFVIQTTDGGFILTGIHGSTIDAFLIKTDSVGRIIGINEPFLGLNQIKIFPNPFSETATLFFKSDNFNFENEVLLSVFDLLGQEVMKKKIIFEKNRYMLDCKGLHSGIYFIQLISNSILIGTQKIIIK